MEKITDNLLARACVQAVEHNPKLDGFEVTKITDENDGCVIYTKEKVMIISFLNSNDIKDWIGNFRFSIKKTVYGGIHTDFWESYEGLFKKIIETMHTLNFHDKEIYITGHSRGGALATIFAVDNPYNLYTKRIVTFGSPRVGDDKFVQTFNKRVKFDSVRYVNNLDLVTTVPFWGYSHVRGSVYFDRKGKIVSKRPKNYLFLIRKITGALNHDLEPYVKNTALNNL